ncbi:MAG: hypothetical protein IKK82_00385 [Kiritimatiellae bacterium]|nr:hypothetical protein [Kiritimatiellia bacterium]
MKKYIAIVFVAGLSGMGIAADVSVEWDMETKQTSLGDGVVTLTYDGSGAIVSLIASPSDNGTVYVTGGKMEFADDAKISLATHGKLVISNDVVSAGVLKIGENDPDAEISYSGAIVSKSEYVPLFKNKRLADYDVKSTYFKYPNGCAGFSNLLGPVGYGTPECVQRSVNDDGTDKLRVLLQQFNDDFLCSVELFLVQQGDDIAGKINTCRYSYGDLNLLGVDLQKYYNEKVAYSNGVNIAVWRSIATETDKGFGINQLTMKRRDRLRIVSFAGNVPEAEMEISNGIDVEYVDSGYGNFAGAKGEGKIAFVSTGTTANYTEQYEGVVKKSNYVVAHNRELSDLRSVEGWFRNVNNKHNPIFMQAHHLRLMPGGKSATCQFQRLVGDTIFCSVVSFEQSGCDIVAKVSNGYNHKTSVDGVAFELGVDFLDGSLPARGNSTVVEKIEDWGLFLKDLTLSFSSPKTATVVVAKPNEMKNESSISICGTAEVPQRLRIADLGGLPTNGVVTVEPYGILDIALADLPEIHGSGVSGGTTEIVVQTNGLLRLSRERAFSCGRQIIRLQGGMWEVGHGLADKDHADYHLYANDLTFADGAKMFGVPARIGFRTAFPAWRVLGSRPSVCDSGLIILKNKLDEKNDTVFQMYVEDVTQDGEVDFTMNGPMNLFASSDDYDEVAVRKVGDGTVLQNGVSELKYETFILRGAWIFGKSGVSLGEQEFHLAGDTMIGLENGVSNGLGKVVVKAPATLQMGEDSLLTLNELELAAGATLEIKGDFSKQSLYVASPVPATTLRRISCPEGRVMQDEEGYIRPRIKTFVISVR